MPNDKVATFHFKPNPASTKHHKNINKNSQPSTKSSKHAPIGWDHVAPTDSFSSYMHHKNRKLRIQFDAEFSKSPKTQIFAGVVVWVNGHTNPSRLQIRRIMGNHGGQLETYYTSKVTHVVAANLATATRLRFTSRTNTSPRVKLVSPRWISDSLVQTRRLPETDYPVPFINNPQQRSIHSFFVPRNPHSKDNSQNHVHPKP